MKARLNVIILLTCFILLPLIVFGHVKVRAATIIASGSCGVDSDPDSVTWTLDSEGTLEFSGSGYMRRYRVPSQASVAWPDELVPWGDHISDIKKVVINDGVLSIGAYVFSEHVNLSEVLIASSVSEIQRYAFDHCSSLKTVVFPQSLRLEDYVFNYCTNLRTITIPSRVDVIPEGTFYACSGLVSVTLNNVKSISKKAFASCKSLSQITLPSNLSTMGESAFYGCSSIKTISIPTKLTKLPRTAFAKCTSLTSVTFSNTITEIGEYAFQGCTSLSVNALPSNLSSMGEAAFYGCSSIKTISLPTNLTKLPERAFEKCTSLTSVTFPNTITEIGDYAFEGCTSLPVNSLPSSLQVLGNMSFSGCIFPTRFELPSNLIRLGGSFFEGTGITEVVIPESVTEIGSRAFAGLTITSIKLPDHLQTLGDAAFYNCKNLSAIHLPDSIQEMGASVFYGCTSLTSVTIPEGVTMLRGTFTGCTNLKKVSLPSGLTTIGRETFYNCTSLSSITIPSGVTVIDRNAFCNTALERIEIPEGVTSLGWCAFQDCKSLKSVILPKNIKEIPFQGFLNCTSLRSITLPEGITSIGFMAFCNCTSLERIHLPETLNYMEEGVFIGCVSLTRIVIPAGITTLVRTFTDDQKLSLIVLLGGSGTVSANNTFANVTAKVYYPSDQPWTLPDIPAENNTHLTWIPYTTLYKVEYKTSATEPAFFSELAVDGERFTIEDFTPTKAGYTFLGWARNADASTPQYQAGTSFVVSRDLTFYAVWKKTEPPAEVTDLKAASAGKGKVRLTWTGSAGAEGYLIYGQKDGKYGYVGMTTQGTTFTDTKALYDDYNYYWVFPYVKDSAGKMVPRDTTKYVFAKGICPAATNLKAASVKGGVKLTWDKVLDAEGYLIYGIVDGKPYGYVGMTTLGTTYTDKKASTTQYNYYWVYPYFKDSNGKMIVGQTAKYTYGRALK